jgi:D-alanyl-D-alanine carboxypeptidase (penicillin-binding protein 5/6)
MSPPQIDARAWLVINANSGRRLAGQAVHRMLPIASTTKLMTAYLALRRLPLSQQVTAPAYKPDGAESLLGLEEGETISVRDLLYALLVASANDGAVTLADAVSGSSERFVELMNRTASSLGLRDTVYANPVGLDAPGEGSSAADLAKLVLVLDRERIFRRITDTERRVITTDRQTRTIETTNSLLTLKPWMNGVKTGFTENAGYVLVGSGTRKGVKLISVVIGAPSEAARNADTLALLRYGFSLYRVAHPVRRGQALARPPVDSGGTVPLVAGRSVELTVRRGDGVETSIEAPPDLEGPISRGEKLGKVTVTVGGRQVDAAPIVAAASAPAPTLAQRFRNAVGFSIWVPVAVLGLIVIGIAAMLLRRARATG